MLYSTVKAAVQHITNSWHQGLMFGSAVITFWRNWSSRHVAQQQLFRKMSRIA
jgi:hypothetical protein